MAIASLKNFINNQKLKKMCDNNNVSGIAGDNLTASKREVLKIAKDNPAAIPVLKELFPKLFEPEPVILDINDSTKSMVNSLLSNVCLMIGLPEKSVRISKFVSGYGFDFTGGDFKTGRIQWKLENYPSLPLDGSARAFYEK